MDISIDKNYQEIKWVDHVIKLCQIMGAIRIFDYRYIELTVPLYILINSLCTYVFETNKSDTNNPTYIWAT